MEREASPQELAAAISLRVERILPPNMDAHSLVAVRRFMNLCLCALSLEAAPELPADADVNAVAVAAARAAGFAEQLPAADLRDGGVAMGLAVAQKGSAFDKLQAELQSRIRENEKIDKAFALLCARE